MLEKTIPRNSYVKTQLLYDEVHNEIKQRLKQQEYVRNIEDFNAGLIVDGRDQRVAIITGNYTPAEMRDDIIKYEITKIIFMHPQKSAVKHFVAAASGLNFSFFQQELPKPMHFAINFSSNTQDEDDEWQSAAFLINRKDHSEGNDYTKDDYILGSHGEPTPRKFWKKFLYDLSIQIISGVVTNCGFYRLLGGVF